MLLLEGPSPHYSGGRCRKKKKKSTGKFLQSPGIPLLGPKEDHWLILNLVEQLTTYNPVQSGTFKPKMELLNGEQVRNFVSGGMIPAFVSNPRSGR